jgi:hypothetical protein
MASLAPGGINDVVVVSLYSTKSDTLSKVFLISKKVVPYQTLGGIGCLGQSSPKNKSLADSSKTNHNP